MANLNITEVYLLNVPLESDYKNTLYFDNKSSQESYFKSKVVKSYTDFSYQRKDNIIRVPNHIDSLWNCNYVMYRNRAYNNKWFYAFIKDMRYINDGTTEIEIETDCIQTWFFDYNVKASFVEREHTNNDTIGTNTVPEGLETGDYVDQVIDSAEIVSWHGLIGNTRIVLAVSDTGLNVAVPSGVKQYNGVFSGLFYLTFPTNKDCDLYIRYIQSKITEDVIYSAFIVPSDMVKNTEYHNISDGTYNFQYGFVPYTTTFETLKSNVPITDNKKIDKDYVPRNNKLLCYPYRYMVVSNNAGSVKEYYYEYFNKTNNECRFDLIGAISPGCAMKLIPRNYLNVDSIPYTYHNYMESLDAPKLPTCGWTNDSYTNWLTQNAVNIPLNLATSGASMIGNLAMGNVSGSASGLMNITSQVASVYEHSLVPITAKGGVNQGDLLFADRILFLPYKKSIKKEYAQIIDKYFDMFGYKVNLVKVPNKNHRNRWWYTKTIDVNIDGAIPNKDMDIIKNCYNSGITFWRNPSEIQNYSLSNGIK